MNNINSKRCLTCNELSPAELNNCQYCGSILPKNNELPHNIQETTAYMVYNPEDEQKSRAEESEVPGLEISKQEEIKDEIIETFNDISSEEDKTNDELTNNEEELTGVSQDQLAFNSIFGFKSSEETASLKTVSSEISNGKKVFLSVICSVIPGLGQLMCLILSLHYMNQEDSEDTRTFGKALFTASIIMFLITFILSFIIAMAVYEPPV